MKLTYVRSLAASLGLLALALYAGAADAQTAAKQPFFVQNQQWVDLGNGPSELQVVEGAGTAYTAGGAGVGTSAASTALTLTASAAANPPCVGCVITCAPSNAAVCTIPAATTVTAFNGTTGITTSVATTTTAASLVWGAPCPASTAPNVPGTPPGATSYLSAPLNMRSGASQPAQNAYPLYSTARICLYGSLQAGLTALQFPVGAH